MKIKVIILLITVLLGFNGCIEPFVPEIKNQSGSLVIEGKIDNTEGLKYIRISKSSSVYDPNFAGVSGCEVEVRDDFNNIFIFKETGFGVYERWFAQNEVVVGLTYVLNVKSYDGIEYISDSVTVRHVPDIDSVEFKREVAVGISSSIYNDGFQVYAKLNRSTKEESAYVSFDLIETWEYSVPHTIEYIYDEDGLLFTPADYLHLKRCWKTVNENSIFTFAHTGDIGDNNIAKLNFITFESSRLQKNYSLLIKANSIDWNAYFYFNELKKRIQTSGGIYDTQPSTIYGNIYEKGNNSQKVLGYFYASAVKTKRIFIKNTFGLKTHEFDNCKLMPPEDLSDLSETLYPYYLSTIQDGENKGALGIDAKGCFDCTLTGGSIIKPEFWDE